MEIVSEKVFNEEVGSIQTSLVIFGAKWCKHCSELKSQLMASELAVNLNISVRYADVDNLPNISDNYGVSSLPHSILFREGLPLGAVVGASMADITNLMNGNTTTITTNPSNDFVEFECPILSATSQYTVVHARSELDSGLLHAVGLGHVNLNPLASAELFTHLTNKITSVFRDRVGAAVVGDLESLYSYQVPTVSKDGTCSNVHKLSSKPFNLARDAYHTLSAEQVAAGDYEAVRSDAMTRRLSLLRKVVDCLYDATQADWIGIYRLVSADGVPTLLKESYRGEASRPLFPVTAAFAEKSTNSWVALTGQVRVIANTQQIEEGVSYYQCSGRVQSELCCPILRQVPQHSSGGGGGGCCCEVLGIVDLESWQLAHFTEEKVLQVLRICLDLGSLSLGMPPPEVV